MAAARRLKVGPAGTAASIQVKVPANDPPPWDSDAKLSVVGSRALRVDGPEKAAGVARYTYDVKLPGMLYGAILRCPYPSAQVVSVDGASAKRLAGVHAVLAEAGTTCRYEGEEVAAVAAETPEVAEEALSLLRVRYDTRPFVTDVERAREKDAPRVFDGPNAREPRTRATGEVEKGRKAAYASVENEFRTQVQTHACLETHGVVAAWEGDKLTVWASTQGTFSVREGLAEALGMPMSRITVHTEFMGGGFGSKFGPGSFAILAAKLARQTGRPVRLMLPRRDEHLATGNRPNAVIRLAAGATREGALTFLHLVSFGTPGIGSGAGVSGPVRNVYACPHVKTEEQDVFTNTGPAAPMRAPGHPQGAFALEQTMDLLAEKLGMDPLEFRRKNDRHPVRRVQYDLGAGKIGWAGRHRNGEGEGHLRRGLGVAAAVWYNTGGPGSTVTVVVGRDGDVEVQNGAQDIGTGTRTVLAMAVAEELGLAPSAISVRIGNTGYPFGPASGGSTTTPSLAPAARAAGAAARAKLSALAAASARAHPDELAFVAGEVRRRGGKRAMTFKECCRLIPGEKIVANGDRAPDYEGWQPLVAGVQFADVEVDLETGRIRPRKIVAIQDCGRVINPLLVESQINGGVIQGLSYALFEERILDPVTGKMVNANLESYKIAGALDVPEIEAVAHSSPAGFNNMGVLGVGEPPVIPTAAAIANAFANATGVRLFELPMTPRRVLAALASAGRA